MLFRSLLVASCILMMSVYVFTFPKYKTEDVMWVFFSIVYVAVTLSYIYQVRMLQDGIYIVWLIFVSSWGNDTCAYFTGVFLGKHKMTPKLSPKKTYEGAIGGVVGATDRFPSGVRFCRSRKITCSSNALMASSYPSTGFAKRELICAKILRRDT